MNANRLRREEGQSTYLQRSDAAYKGVLANVHSFASLHSGPTHGAKPSPKI